MNEFSRRRYRCVSEAASDLWRLSRRRREIRRVMKGGAIDARLRERLMLAVTEVNGCRYCAFAHARAALATGLTAADIDALAKGEMGGCPPQDVVALLYARHWAEADGRPDREARRRVLETYGETRLEHIELVLQMIRVGNLLGNTWDYMLCRLSRGRLGDAEGRRASVVLDGHLR